MDQRVASAAVRLGPRRAGRGAGWPVEVVLRFCGDLLPGAMFGAFVERARFGLLEIGNRREIDPPLLDGCAKWWVGEWLISSESESTLMRCVSFPPLSFSHTKHTSEKETPCSRLLRASCFCFAMIPAVPWFLPADQTKRLVQVAKTERENPGIPGENARA